MSLKDSNSRRHDFYAALKSAERTMPPADDKRPLKLTPDQWQQQNKDQYNQRLTELTRAALGGEDVVSFFKEHLLAQKAVILEPPSRAKILPTIASHLSSESDSGNAKEAPHQPRLLSGDNPFIHQLKAASTDSDELLPVILNAATTPLEALKEGEPDCISTAEAGAAESGTLFLVSGPENPTPLNFLARRHIVLIKRNKIFAAYEEALAEIDSQSRKQGSESEPAIPRTINMISGPSRTADIEQTLTLGAHGPVELIIVIYE